jgi:hypothetical protein
LRPIRCENDHDCRVDCNFLSRREWLSRYTTDLHLVARSKKWVELYLHSPSTPSCCGAQLKHRDNFTFTFYSENYWEHFEKSLSI